MCKMKLNLLFKSRIPKLFCLFRYISWWPKTKWEKTIYLFTFLRFPICKEKGQPGTLQLFQKTNKLVIHIWFLITDSCNETDIRQTKKLLKRYHQKNRLKTSYFVLKIQMRQFMLWLRTQLGVTTTHWVSKSMWFNQLVIW
jgi:hypothetical protein